MKNLAFILLIFLFGCNNPAAKIAISNRTKASTKLLKGYLQAEGDHPVHSILLYLNEPNFNNHQAVGTANGKTQKIEKDFQFRIASVTKTFTATLVLQMAEEGLFQLDDPIYDYVKGYDFVKIDSLHINDGVSYSKLITIQQLLQHRSGLIDFYDDLPQFVGYMESHKRKYWTAPQLFTYYYEKNLNLQASFKPGDASHYSDVNFLLLTLLVEKISETPIAEQYRKRIFEPLGMKNSYFEYFEKPVGHGKMAHTFFQKEDINLSGRWSGNGLVSTTKELGIFIEALMTGQLFKEKESLEKMMQTYPANKKYRYGMGLMELSILEKKYYGHSGFWGIHLLYCPEDKRTISLRQIKKNN